MPVHFPSESGLPAEATHGRSNGRAPDSVRLGFHFMRRENRCRSGLHRLDCGGSTPPSRRVWVANCDSEVPALNRRELGANPRRPTISASVVKLLSCSASNGEFAGGSPAGCTNLRACGLTRIAEGPDSESGSLGGASPFMPTISRRLASAGTADPGDLKSPSLPGASPGSPTGVWFAGNSRPVRLKPEQPWECKSPHADQSGMSTGQACRACLLNSACLRASGASPRHSAIGV